MPIFDSIEYHISDHFLGALINADHSGLTDAEQFQLGEFEYQVRCDAPVGFEFGNFSHPSDYWDSHGVCAICGLESKIVPIVAIYWSKNNE
jgi:hypothetical protein